MNVTSVRLAVEVWSEETPTVHVRGVLLGEIVVVKLVVPMEVLVVLPRVQPLLAPPSQWRTSQPTICAEVCWGRVVSRIKAVASSLRLQFMTAADCAPLLRVETVEGEDNIFHTRRGTNDSKRMGRKEGRGRGDGDEEKAMSL